MELAVAAESSLDFARKWARRSPRYLFLDFDGVLHSADAHFALENVKVSREALCASGLFQHVDLLADLVRPHRELRLVVHSSWRETHSDTELRQVLGGLSERFAGATTRGLDRQQSIIDYAMRHRLTPSDYRVLDDHAHLLPELHDVTVVCDPQMGLATPGVAQSLRTWLHERR